MIFAENIKDRALFEGFNKVGIVGAQSLDDEGRRLREWVARGHHREMSWIARDVHKRISPQENFPQSGKIRCFQIARCLRMRATVISSTSMDPAITILWGKMKSNPRD